MQKSYINSDLSIVIVNYRGWERLNICLEKIKNISSQIIVVDNNSNDKKIHFYRNKFKKVTWIVNEFNSGFSNGCNIGAQIVKNKWILFLNPDTIIEEKTLKTLIQYCDLNSKFHLITIKQLDENNKNTHPYGIFPNFINIIPIFRTFERIFFKKNQRYKIISNSEVAYPDWISGSFILIRNKHFKELNGWDENFWMYCEDVDFSLRASKIGLNRVILNNWKCIHIHGGSSRIDIKTKVITKTEVIISTQKYINKHFNNKTKMITTIYYLIYNLVELLIQFPFSNLKRKILIRLIKYYVKKSPLFK